MFDVGFWELGLIGVIALLVIGPERLPAVARSIGQWVAKAKNFMSYMQADFKEEINKTEELKRLLTEQSKIKEIHEIIEQSVTDARSGVSINAPLAKHEVKSFDNNTTATVPDSSDSLVDSSKTGTDNSSTNSATNSSTDTSVDSLNNPPTQAREAKQNKKSDVANSQPVTKAVNEQTK
jgi:sec-independent protein translocase protein TatB